MAPLALLFLGRLDLFHLRASLLRSIRTLRSTWRGLET
jgi:hypothetical protein